MMLLCAYVFVVDWTRGFIVCRHLPFHQFVPLLPTVLTHRSAFRRSPLPISGRSGGVSAFAGRRLAVEALHAAERSAPARRIRPSKIGLVPGELVDPGAQLGWPNQRVVWRVGGHLRGGGGGTGV